MYKVINKIKELYSVKFIKDTIMLQAGTVTIMIVGFVTTVIIARILHAANYGVYALILSLYGLVNFLGDFGIKKATVIGLTEACAKNDHHLIEDILAFYLKVTLVVGLIIFVIGLIFCPYLAGILYNNKEIGNLTRLLFLMAPLGIFYELIHTIFHGLMMITYLTILENILRLCKTVLIVIALMFGFGLPGIIISLAVSPLICSIIAISMYKKIQLKIKDTPCMGRILRKIRKVHMGAHFRFGLSMTLDKSIFDLYGIVPIVILGRFASYSEVGYFKISKDLITYFVYLFWPVYQNLSVKLPAVLIREGVYNLRRFFLKVSLCSGAAVIILAVCLLFFASFFIAYFYGSEYRLAETAVYILLVYLVVAGFNVGLPALYQTLKQVKPIIYIKFLTMILLLPLGLLLIKFARVEGAAIFYVCLIFTSSLATFIFINHRFIILCRDNTAKFISVKLKKA